MPAQKCMCVWQMGLNNFFSSTSSSSSFSYCCLVWHFTHARKILINSMCLLKVSFISPMPTGKAVKLNYRSYSPSFCCCIAENVQFNYSCFVLCTICMVQSNEFTRAASPFPNSVSRIIEFLRLNCAEQFVAVFPITTEYFKRKESN